MVAEERSVRQDNGEITSFWRASQKMTPGARCGRMAHVCQFMVSHLNQRDLKARHNNVKMELSKADKGSSKRESNKGKVNSNKIQKLKKQTRVPRNRKSRRTWRQDQEMQQDHGVKTDRTTKAG